MAESTLFVFRSVLRICSYFNPRTPVGCDMRQASDDQSKAISIHAPQWGATSPGSSGLPCEQISIHAPQWGATTTPDAGKSNTADFNPRTPVGCDHHYPGNGDRAVHISIHAPQWGATRRRRDHTPIRKYFNPRTPVGCDNQLQRGQSVPIRISIHAPQWGATGRVPGLPKLGCISIHAPQWGATCILAPTITRFTTFQSTHPSGVRPAHQPHRARTTHFNPRTPVGCDLHPPVTLDNQTISIHAPQWGATPCVKRFIILLHISIHAPQWGATMIHRATVGFGLISIHAPQWGATMSVFFSTRSP